DGLRDVFGQPSLAEGAQAAPGLADCDGNGGRHARLDEARRDRVGGGPAIDDRHTTRPLSRRSGSSAAVVWMTAARLIPRTLSHCSGFMRPSVLSRVMPALFTMMSIPPSGARAAQIFAAGRPSPMSTERAVPPMARASWLVGPSSPGRSRHTT